MFDLAPEKKKSVTSSILKDLIKMAHRLDKEGEEANSLAEASPDGKEEDSEVNEAPMDGQADSKGESEASEEEGSDESLSSEQIAELLKDKNKAPKKKGMVAMSIMSASKPKGKKGRK